MLLKLATDTFTCPIFCMRKKTDGKNKIKNQIWQEKVVETLNFIFYENNKYVQLQFWYRFFLLDC